VQEEIFGPVVTAIPFKDPSDLVAQANDSVYGLAAGIWTRDIQKAHRLAAQLRAGTVWIIATHFRRCPAFRRIQAVRLGDENGTRRPRTLHRSEGRLYCAVNKICCDWKGSVSSPSVRSEMASDRCGKFRPSPQFVFRTVERRETSQPRPDLRQILWRA